MSIIPAKIRAVVFDYGNTLIEFSPHQVECEYATLQRALTQMFGACEEQHIKAVRDRQIVAPYENNYKENDLRVICAELIKEIYNHIPSDEQFDAADGDYEPDVRITHLCELESLLLP